MTTHDVLRKARAYLLEHGWDPTGDGYGDPGRPQCAMGALKVTMGAAWDTDVPTSVAACEGFLRGAGLTASASIPTWNDAPDRTFDDVIAAFDKAIAATAPPLDDTPIFQALEGLPAEDYIECLSVLALIPAEALA